MKMKKFYHGLLLSVFCSSSLCYGAEYCNTDTYKGFELKYDLIYDLEDDPSYLGSGCSARVCKSTYNGKAVALKIFKIENSDKSDLEFETCKKILEYSKNNKLGSGLMKVFGLSKTLVNNKVYNISRELPTIIFEFIDGVTLNKWLKNNNFEDTNSFIDDFCIPLIEAFKEYYKITGEIKREVKSENIMMRKNDKNNWEPVLIDYGQGSVSPISDLYDTLSSCCENIKNRNEKFNKLSRFFTSKRDCGGLDQDIFQADEILKKINEIKNN